MGSALTDSSKLTSPRTERKRERERERQEGEIGRAQKGPQNVRSAPEQDVIARVKIPNDTPSLWFA